jgi:hypothetical protein
MKEAHDMINTKWHEDWSHLAVGDPTDDTVVPNPVATVRALVDWVADIMAVLRAAGVAYPALADSTKGSTFWCVEHLHSKVATLVTGGTASSDLTPGALAVWAWRAEHDREAMLCDLADEFAYMLAVLNRLSGARTLKSLSDGHAGRPYWWARSAFVAVLTLLTGSEDDAWVVADLWSDNQVSTAHNLGLLAADKAARTVVVTVTPSGNTAEVRMPDGSRSDAGRMDDPDGRYWGTDGKGNTATYAPTWGCLARRLADFHGYGPDVIVKVEFA